MESLIDRNRLRLRAALVTLLCLSGSALSLRALYRDLRSASQNAGGTVMAILERHEQKVRVKHAGSFSWNGLEDQDSLYKKDSLQTGEQSGASVKLKDGTILELGENSLIVIDELADLSLNFGQVVLRKASGEDVQIAVDKSGKKRTETLVVRALAPENFSRNFTRVGQRLPVEFRWEAKSGDPELRPSAIQLSRDRRFSGQSLSIPITEEAVASGKTVFSLATGRYHWRIVNSRKSPLSTPLQFRVAQAVPLRPVAPQLSSPVVIWGGAGAVQLRWGNPLVQASGAALTDAPEAGDFTSSSHRVQLSRSADFSAPFLQENALALAGAITLKSLAPGRYFWRLASQYGSQLVASAPFEFVVELGKRLPIQLAFPADDVVAEALPKQRFAWSTDALQGTDYVVEWKTGQGAVQRTERSPSKMQLVAGVPVGKHSWRVVAWAGDLGVGESEWRNFSIVQGKPVSLRTPLAKQEVYHWGETPQFSFAWDTDAEVEKTPTSLYVFEVSNLPDFSVLSVVRKLREPRLGAAELKLPDGSYSWRVKIVNAAGETLKVSAPRLFSLSLHPPLRAPASEQVEPRIGATVDYQAQPGGLVLTWPTVEDASAYQVSLFKKLSTGQADAKPVFQKKVMESRLGAGILPEGEYVWSVRAIDRLGRHGQALPLRGLKTSYGAPLGAPRALSSEVQ